MNPWIAKVIVLAGTLTMIAIRAPHGRRSRSVKVVKSHKTSLETGLLVLAWVGFFVPLIWLASPVLSFADYPLRLGPLITGVICFVVGLWLFYRSHAELARIGRSPWRCVSSIDSSRKACIAGSAIQCTRRSCCIPWAMRWSSRIGWQVRRIW